MKPEIDFNPEGKGILCFGELLLRICPDTDANWLKENNLPCYVGGAELNVASALALWELPASYMTAMPDNLMSRQLENYIQEKGIDTSPIKFQGKRIGLYYLPKGEDVKHAGVIYDREHSAFAELEPGTINWAQVFEGISWFHFSAICPALSASVAAVCKEALQYASAHGIFVSLDLNYRAKLWQYGKQPIDVVPDLAPYCDLIMGNIWAAELMLGIPIKEGLKELDLKSAYLEQAKFTSMELMKRYPKCKIIGNTYRFDVQGKGIKYYTTLYGPDKFYFSAEYSTPDFIDKVGSGDCFMAGLIYGFYRGDGYQETLDFATAAAFNKLFIASDATSTSVAEIQGLIKPAEN